jgi:hypothetical protein
MRLRVPEALLMDAFSETWNKIMFTTFASTLKEYERSYFLLRSLFSLGESWFPWGWN